MSMDSVSEQPQLLGVGLYTLSDAARYVGVSRQRMGQWVGGRPSRASDEDANGTSRRTEPVLVTQAQRIDNEVVLSFLQLVELRLVELFRKYGVSMNTIRLAARNLARILGTDYPFSSVHLQTDGQRIFGEMHLGDAIRKDAIRLEGTEIDSSQITYDLKQLQTVMGDIVRVYFKDTEYDDNDIASRWWLLGSKDNRALMDPKRSFGQPIDDPTGVPLSALYALVQAGDTAQDVADWYRVPIDAVDAAIAFYTSRSMSLK